MLLKAHLAEWLIAGALLRVVLLEGGWASWTLMLDIKFKMFMKVQTEPASFWKYYWLKVLMENVDQNINNKFIIILHKLLMHEALSYCSSVAPTLVTASNLIMHEALS
jgi:hypothetical protein